MLTPAYLKAFLSYALRKDTRKRGKQRQIGKANVFETFCHEKWGKKFSVGICLPFFSLRSSRQNDEKRGRKKFPQ